MGQTKLTIEENIQVLTLLEEGISIIHVAMDLKVTRLEIYSLIKPAAVALLSTIPQQKGSKESRKSSSRTEKLLKLEMIDPYLSLPYAKVLC